MRLEVFLPSENKVATSLIISHLDKPKFYHSPYKMQVTFSTVFRTLGLVLTTASDCICNSYRV